MPTRFDLRCESEKSIVGEQTAHKAITNQLKQLHSKHSQDFQRRDCCPHWQEHDRLESQGIWGRGICSPKHLRSNQAAPKQLLVSRTYVLRGHPGLLTSPTPTLLPKEPFLISESVGMHLIMRKQGYTRAISAGEPERKSHKS